MVFLPPQPAAGPAGGPSAAAAAGAAAAALLQQQQAADVAGARIGTVPEPGEGGWTEHQTGDGRKFYHHEETDTSTWDKPDALMTPEERANDTKWREYRIWDGRVFYHNRDTKVSCWSMPPDLRKLRGESSGIDDTPLPFTSAEKRRAFCDLLKETGVDESWDWRRTDEATGDSPEAQALDERARKQTFAEFLGISLRRKTSEALEKERDVAGALERLIEERFGRPEDVGVTYEEASRALAEEEAWKMVKSDMRRDEVFQEVMERLEERHNKARAEKRSAHVVRLQRLLASDVELRRQRVRWKDVSAILARKDELPQEEQPLEALRVWGSLRNLKTAAEHEAETKARVKADQAAYRAERKRRDDFVMCLKELIVKGSLKEGASWVEAEKLAEGDSRSTAMRESAGATSMELFDEVMEDLRARGSAAFTTEVPVSVAAAAAAARAAPADGPERPRKRMRFDPEPAPPIAAKEEEAVPASASALNPGDEDTNPLDALINAVGILPGGDEKKEEAKKEEPKAEAESEIPTPQVIEAALPVGFLPVGLQQTGDPKASAPAAQKQSGFTSAELLAKRVDDLKAMCRDRGLPVSGKKQELVERLISGSTT